MVSAGQDADVDQATTPFGQMRISKNEISYVGETHWNAILNSISDLKRDLGDEDSNDGEDGEHDSAYQPQLHLLPDRPGFTGNVHAWTMGSVQPYATTGLGFMLGNHAPVTKEQLIASVPEKKVADRLLSLWFNSPDPFKPILHAPTFQEEYKRFWRNPNHTPIMWLGLLFSIISLSASFGLRETDPNSEQAKRILQEVNRYHSLAASAAILADFTKPKEYTIECLVLYTAGLRSNNAFVNVWLMIGLIVRLALRMGYHRDPKHYPNITPFHGEMRRRTWGIISMIDVLISFQLGLPSMVKTIQSDAEPPHNLLDRDFNPETKVLPPSRGINELTPSSYTRAKLKITRVFADAAELSHATIPPTREVMMELDRRLEDAKNSIPPLLSMPDTSDIVTDPAEQLMCRFNLDLLYLKAKIVLHRRYMLCPLASLSPEERMAGIGNSRRICVDCALKVLQHHHTIYTASQPGGQLESVKWYMGSISTHDFLLAAMIICLELSQQINDTPFATVLGGISCPRQQAMMDALEKSQRIWADASRLKPKHLGNQFQGSDDSRKGEHMFDETEKASRAMAAMLEKVRKRRTNCGGIEVEGGWANGKERAPRVPQIRDSKTGHLRIDASRAWGEQQPGDNWGISHGAPFLGVLTLHEWDGEMPQLPSTGDLGKELSSTLNPTNDMAAISSGLASGLSVDLTASGDPANNGRDTGSSSNGTGSTPGAIIRQESSGKSNVAPSSTNATNQSTHNFGITTNGTNDFSTIGNMLDITASNMDWEMWDQEVIRGMDRQIQWQDQVFSGEAASTGKNTFDSPLPSGDFDLFNMRYGNALTGGSGPGVCSSFSFDVPNSTIPETLPGNATVHDGTGIISQDSNGSGDVNDINDRFDVNGFSGNNMGMDLDFDSLPLDDVDFGLGVQDYN